MKGDQELRTGDIPASHRRLQGNFKLLHFLHSNVKGLVVDGEDMSVRIYGKALPYMLGSWRVEKRITDVRHPAALAAAGYLIALECVLSYQV